MAFELFEHKADIGIRGFGRSTDEAFAEAGKALFEVMCDTSKVDPLKAHKFVVEAPDLGALLVKYLNELLFVKDTKKMLYSQFRVKIAEQGNPNGEKSFKLEGVIFGEKIDTKKHSTKVDPKAATYSQLLVEKKSDGKWVAQCIIDV